jgi:hypothetical protein
MNKHYYAARTHLHSPDGRPTDFGESRTDISGSLEHYSQHVPIASASTRLLLDHSIGGLERARPAAGVVVTRLLAVLVVVMVITSILGFTVFDRQEGNSATAIVSLAIGGAAAVLGLMFGFREAHQAS